MMAFLKKVLAGFGLGLGFAVAVVGVGYISSDLMMGKMTEDAYSEAEVQISESRAFKTFNEGSGISIKSHKERAIKNGLEILAEIENTGDVTWSSVSVEVELFDGQNQFLDECTGYLQGKLAPQQVKNLKVKCGGCEHNPLPAHSSYTITIVDAYAR